MYQKRSPNYRILRQILSKMRQMEYSEEISYLVIFTFLYKCSSDRLKQYLMHLIENKTVTLDEAYKNDDLKEDLRAESLQMFGYFINDIDWFMDEIINSSYSDRFFIHEFFEAFSTHVEFTSDSNYEKYFTFIFDSLKSEINFSKFEFEGENHLIVKDIIYSISRLDTSEIEYPFLYVFNSICRSRPLRVDQDPEYISQLLSALITSTKTDYVDVYNPFLNDGSSLINFMAHYNLINASGGRGFDRIAHCACIVKLFIYNFNLEKVFLEFSSTFESKDMSQSSHDVILSKIPAMTYKNLKKLNKAQNIESVKKNKRAELEKLLADRLDLNRDSFLSDDELSSSLDTLLDKMDLEKHSQAEFSGEYESLKDSEYLFLVNLINSLNDDGIMAVGMSQSFLFKNSLETLRKYLTVEKNCIDAVISIPDEFSRKKNSEIIVVFRKNKNTSDIVFMDLSKSYDAVPSKYPVSGLFRRNMIFSDEFIRKVVDIYTKRITVDKFSEVVDLSNIEKNEFNLSVSRYVDTFEGEFITLSQLRDDRQKIDENLEKLNKKIDLMMRDLNIRL